MTKTHFRTCPLCEAMCGLELQVEGDRVTKVRGDRDDPFSAGHICPKAAALPDLHADPDRVLQPLRRVGSGWEPVGWDEALEDIADRFVALQRDHGGDSVAMYTGNPSVHNTTAMLAGPLLLKALKSRNRYSATSVDQLPHMFAAHQVLGHQLLLPIPDVDRTDLFVVLGANPMASNGSIMSAPDMRGRLRALRRRGGRVVLFDPRRTETAAEADDYHPIRPGSDVWLLLALVHEVFRTDGVRLGHLEGFTDGVDTLRDRVQPYTPQRAAAVTGVPAPVIVDLAAELVRTRKAVVYGRTGSCTQRHGGLVGWLLLVLNTLTGHLDTVGGAMFTTPALDILDRSTGLGLGRGGYARFSSRVRGLPEVGGELPVAVLAEEILTEGTGQVRGLLTLAGNPVLSTPNGRQLDQALGRLDLMVSIDPYINETTRHAHYVLPPASALERPHYDVVFHALAVRNTARYCPPLFEPSEGVRQDGAIVLDLLQRVLSRRHGRLHPRVMRVRALRAMGWRRMLDIGLRLGPHGAGVAGLRRRGTLSIRTLEAHPHGVDLGPLEPGRLPGRLQPEAPRIELAPAAILEGLSEVVEPEQDGLLLIGRRHVRDNNSWLHNSKRLVKGPDRCTLMIHPRDAAERGLQPGHTVVVTSRVGHVEAPVEITDQVMRGVVSLPHGYGHGRQGVRLRVASAHAGVSANDVTDDRLVDPLTGTAALNGVPVTVGIAGTDASPVG